MAKPTDINLFSKKDLAKYNEDVQRFEDLLKNAVSDPWWVRFIELIADRRNTFLQTFLDGSNDQRTEDRIRGQVTELNFIMILDAKGKSLIEEEKEKGASDHGRQ